jgi:AraC family transcriptional activator of mtrCDE
MTSGPIADPPPIPMRRAVVRGVFWARHDGPIRNGHTACWSGLVDARRGNRRSSRRARDAERVSITLFALALRLASKADSAPVGLLALAGHPRLAPALAALFNEPARQWSLPELARISNRSRATLARQFQKKLGRSATDLLTDIRMTLAVNELKKSSMSTSAVAEAVGYQSEAAFPRAFKSHMGMTPAQWRKTQELSSADLFPVRWSSSKAAQ